MSNLAVMKWAGGKAKRAETISDAFEGPCKGTYYEPFVGSAAIFLYRKKAGLVGRAVLSDVNGKLMEVHKAIRDDVEGVISTLESMKREMAEWKTHYYANRAFYNAGPFEGILHAARFLWLNRTCFNGLYRENKQGEFNAPIGSYKKPAFPTPEHLREVSLLLQGVQIETADFRSILASVGEGDQVYCDPPFVPLTATANFTAYSAGGFDEADQAALASMARWGALRGANVLLSNHDLPVVRSNLYPADRGFEVVTSYQAARSISRKAESRAGVKEALFRIHPGTVRSAQEKNP